MTHKKKRITPMDKAAIELNRQEHTADTSIWDILKHLFMWKDSPKDKI